LPGYLYDRGAVVTTIPLDELMALARIEERAKAADRSPDFSRLIRVGVPSPVTQSAKWSAGRFEFGALVEDDLGAASISALAALAGAMIGGLTSFAAGREARTAKLEALYNEYISLAAGLYADALTHQTDELSKLVPLYALGSRMRLVSARAVTDAAIRIDDAILQTYMAPNRTLQEARQLVKEGEMKDLLIAFSEACREDLAARA